MAHTTHRRSAKIEEFSLPLFTVTVLVTLAALLAGLRFAFPEIWTAQFTASWWRGLAVFAAISLLNGFIEYFFHRYVLHQPAIPGLRRLYRQHTLHHGLTNISRRNRPDGRGVVVIENKFPILEPEQGEASFFPWYTLAVFAGAITPILIALQWLLPAFPWFLGGYAALASSLALYEILHAINHWSLDKWLPLIEHRRWGWFWRPVYGFHLRHHAVIDCNESISGFFGLPVADWVFGTCIIPRTIYADGEEWAPGKFSPPRPVALIRWLDARAIQTVQRRRAAAKSAPAAPGATPGAARAFTRGEEIANWVTHGIGLMLSIAALTLLIVYSSLRGDAWHVVSFTVFGLTLLVLYAASTFYHFWRSSRGKAFFRKVDHIAVFLLIAGTYTPLLLTNLRGPWGWSLFGVVWGLCGAGAVFQFMSGGRFRFLSMLACLFIGWLIVIAVKPLIALVPDGALWLLLAGGLCYTGGVVFYRWHRLRYHHAMWHTFVLGGSTCHFLAVLLFLLPRAA